MQRKIRVKNIFAASKHSKKLGINTLIFNTTLQKEW